MTNDFVRIFRFDPVTQQSMLLGWKLNAQWLRNEVLAQLGIYFDDLMAVTDAPFRWENEMVTSEHLDALDEEVETQVRYGRRTLAQVGEAVSDAWGYINASIAEDHRIWAAEEERESWYYHGGRSI